MNAVAPVALFGPLGPVQLACLRSWRRAGVPTCFIHTVDRLHRPGAAKLADHYHQILNDFAKTDDGLAQMACALRNWQVRGIATVAYENFIFLKSLKARHDLDVIIYGPDSCQLPFLDSKIAQNKCAVDSGFDCLPTTLIASDQPSIQTEIGFPLVARPDQPHQFRPTFKAEMLESNDELQSLINSFQVRDGTIVLQEFQKLPNLVIHGFRSVSGVDGPMAAFVVERKFEGVTLTIRPISPPGNMFDKCRRFCAAAGITGPYHFEFLYCAVRNKSFFLDFNGRLGGTTGKVARLGYNEPLALLEAYEHLPKGTVHYDQPRIRQTAVNRVALVKAMLRQLGGDFSTVDLLPYQGTKAFLDFAKGFMTWTDEVIDFSDPIGSWVYFQQTLIGN